jgi:hypothetical protein
MRTCAICFTVSAGRTALSDRQSSFSTRKDGEAVEVPGKGYKYPEITGWVRANKEDLALVKQMGLRETGI